MNFQHGLASTMTVQPEPNEAASPTPNTQSPNTPPGGPSGAPETSSSEKSGCGCVGWFLGCGCLSVMVVMLLGTIGAVIMLWQAPRAVGADGWGEVAELVETAVQAADGAGEGLGGLLDGDGDFSDLSSLGGEGGLQEQEAAANHMDTFIELLDEPITARDVDHYEAEMAEWENSEAVREFQEILESARQLQDADESLMNGLRLMRTGTEFAFTAKDLGEAYANHSDESFRRSHAQFSILAWVSQTTAGNRQEPWEQAVADALLDEHDENREEFENKRALTKEMMSDESFDLQQLSPEEQQELMEAVGGQFRDISSAINRDTLVTWASLTERERQQIIEQSQQPHNLIAHALSVAHLEDGEAANLFPLLGL